MENNNNQTYPVILHPVADATLVLPSDDDGNRKVRKQGQSELIAFARFLKYGCEEIREDVCVNICGHNYEPDFAYINPEKGVCIDIEIDEPYATSGHAPHFLLDDGTNKDSARNRRFQNAGWYVVRFSEKQIFCNTGSCLKTIYNLLMEVGAIDKMPRSLEKAPMLYPQPRWTKKDSWQMMQDGERMSYLGYDPTHFGFKAFCVCAIRAIPIAMLSITQKRIRKKFLRQIYNFVLNNIR